MAKFKPCDSLKESTLLDIIIEALQTDGEHHKQWYLEQLMMKIGIDENEMEDYQDANDWEKGIAP